jgi:UPF0716 protein FxsA
MSVLIRISLLLIVVPMVELVLLLTIADLTGFTAALALVIGTGLTGAWLLRWQGTKTLQSIRTELSGGRIPQTKVLDGALILVAGALLLTPGVLTDFLGLLLLVPPTRAVLRHWLVEYFRTRWRLVRFDSQGNPEEPIRSQSEVIDSYVVTRSDDGDND